MPKENSGLDEIFNLPKKINLGITREVWEGPQGKEGTDFIVKTRQGPVELEILKFLSESGMSEKLLSYDDKTLVLSKVQGVNIGYYLYDLVKNHSMQVTEEIQIGADHEQKNDTRFRIVGQASAHIPESSALEQEEVRRFYVDYISKVMTLVLCGIFHRDVKADNIMVTPDGETRFIDFGVSMKAERGSKPTIHRAWDEVNDLLKILEKLNPAFHDHLPPMNSIDSWWKLFEELYSKFEKVSLKERPKIVLEMLKGGRLKNLLQEMKFPEEVITEIEIKILEQLKKI